jgi:hypothetical protein
MVYLVIQYVIFVLDPELIRISVFLEVQDALLEVLYEGLICR